MAWMATLVGHGEILAEAGDLRGLFNQLLQQDIPHGARLSIVRVPPFENDHDGFVLTEEGVVIEVEEGGEDG